MNIVTSSLISLPIFWIGWQILDALRDAFTSRYQIFVRCPRYNINWRSK